MTLPDVFFLEKLRPLCQFSTIPFFRYFLPSKIRQKSGHFEVNFLGKIRHEIRGGFWAKSGMKFEGVFGQKNRQFYAQFFPSYPRKSITAETMIVAKPIAQVKTVILDF